MKLFELLKDIDILKENSYVRDAMNLIIDLIISLKAQNILEIDLNQFLKEIEENGYDINKKYLIDLLISSNLIEKIANDRIFLKRSKFDKRSISKELEKQQSKQVEKLASKAIKRRLKD